MSIYDIIIVAGGTFSGACYCENGQGRKGDHPCPTNGDHYCDICDPGFNRITNAGSTLRSNFLVRLAQFRKLPGFSSEIVGRDFFSNLGVGPVFFKRTVLFVFPLNAFVRIIVVAWLASIVPKNREPFARKNAIFMTSISRPKPDIEIASIIRLTKEQMLKNQSAELHLCIKRFQKGSMKLLDFW